MHLPREVIVGKGSLNLVGEVCSSLGFARKALIITGTKTLRIAGQKVMDILQNEGLEVHCHIVSSQSPTMEDVKEAEEKIRRYEPQVVFGVGGGTKIDIAKLSSANQNVPFISIPTTASHLSLIHISEPTRPY